MNRKLGIALLPAIAFLLAGCAGLSNIHATGCSGGKCATVNVSTAKPSQDATTTAPAPAVTVTASPEGGCQGGPCPSVTDTPVSLGPCTVSLDYGSLQQLATSQAAREAEAWCMQIPQANQAAFEQWLAQYALQALNSGQFSTYQKRHDWATNNLAGAYQQYR